MLRRFIHFIDALNEQAGRVASWLVVLCVLTCAATALLRYVFNVGFVWMQDLYVVEFALVFLLCAGYAYGKDQHVRVDILYARASERRRAWINIAGIVLFLGPWLALLAYTALPFVVASWRVLEPSPQAGGLPGFYLVKSLILVFALLLGLQGLSELAKSILVIRSGAAAEASASADRTMNSAGANRV